MSTLAPKKLCSEKKSCMQEQCVMVASNTFIKLIILYFQEEKCLSNHFPPKIHRRPAPTNPKQSLKLTARMRITLSCEKFPSRRPRQSANSASDLPRLEVRFTTQTLSVSYLLCLFHFQSSDSSLKLGPLYEFGYCVAHLYCLMFRQGCIITLSRSYNLCAVPDWTRTAQTTRASTGSWPRTS